MSERLQTVLYAFQVKLTNLHAQSGKQFCAVRIALIAELTGRAKDAAEIVESIDLVVQVVGGEGRSSAARVSRLQGRLDAARQFCKSNWGRILVVFRVS